MTDNSNKSSEGFTMSKSKISLIGGGQIGGNLALLAAQKELGDIVIFDIPKAEGMVKGKALDLMQLRPHDGYDSNITGTSDWNDLKNTDVFIITAGIPRKPGMDREDLLEINLGIMKDVATQIKKHAPNAFVIVISNPLDAMVYAFHKVSGFSKNMVVGMAGALDSGRFRTFIAMETGLSVQDVTCMVLGGHGDTMVPITRLATVGGVPVTDLISPERLKEIEDRTRVAGGEIVKLFGNGSAFYAPAQSAIEMAESYLRDKKRVIPCASLCEGEFGVNGYFIGVPTVIGAGGVEKILDFTLTADEKAKLNNTLDGVKKTVSETGL
jgi:malate dehydrogenase